ncbi:P-type ATPase [Trebonia kvetii]|uniref:P-type ATPase n=1 Tax=Trebonia kvetii TaxID=2480626 RepID=UPI001C9E22B2|nr:hypothetical protein [Trebonia kvetii]
MLVLAEGDIVSADAAVVEAAALLVDESALTGESVPVEKAAAAGGTAILVVGSTAHKVIHLADRPVLIVR